MDGYTSPKLLSLQQALDKMLTQIMPLQETEQVELTTAAGYITATAITSPSNVPSFANSAMDGYAVRSGEITVGEPMQIVGKAFAGAPYQGAFPPRSCIRIMTGAAIPMGADAVIMQEQAEADGEKVSFSAAAQRGQNIRQPGEDIQQGSCVLPAGVKLSAAQLPLLASLGLTDVEVFRPLRVAIFSTGDELRPVGDVLQAGEIYDTNRFAVRLMLAEMGCQVIDFGIIPDHPERLRQTFMQADAQADVVISSGGVSVGEADYTKQILDAVGQVSFWKLAIKPGKPFAFGKLQQAWFCGLPGNPVSAALTFYQLVQPLLAKFMGHSHWHPPLRLRAKAMSNLKKSPDRLDFQRGIFSRNSEGELEVRTTGHQGSHVFSSFSQGNCFIILEREQGHVVAGEYVEIEPFNALLGG